MQTGWTIAFFFTLAACGPERLVLTSSPSEERDATADVEVEADVGDVWDPGMDARIPCMDDWECAPGAVCEQMDCVACAELPNQCIMPCPDGSQAVPIIRNGCAVCVCESTPCFVHAECPPGLLCAGGACSPCDQVENYCWQSCSEGFNLVATVRNGCPVCECAPLSECSSDEDCGGPPMRCFPGAQCDDGCDGSPWCCHGNLCGWEGCPDTYMLSCSAVGCPSGLTCMSGCPRPKCMCDPGLMSWVCEPDCMEAVCLQVY